MTRFALCWNRDGGPVPPEVRRVVGDALARRAGAAPLARSGGDFVAWCAPSGWAGDGENALPLELGGWIGTGALRLDDRQSLAARLRDRGAVDREDDATLALQSFAVWGEKAPEQWLGDYALAVLSADRGRLCIARGTLGVIHCFHGRAGPLTIVSDDPAVIGEVPGVDASLDERAVVEYLATGELVSRELTFRRGVHRVPASHTVIIQRDGRVVTTRHWTPPVPEQRAFASPGTVIEEFSALMRVAVRDRLRAPKAGLLLSGGVDSALLAHSLTGGVAGPPVSALTVSWKRMLPADEDASWARRTAAMTGIAHEVVELGPADAIGAAGAIGAADAIGAASAIGAAEWEPYETPEPAPDPEPMLSRLVASRLAALGPLAMLGEDPDAILFPPTLLDQVRVDGVLATLRTWTRQLATGQERPWVGVRRSFGALEHWRERRGRRAPGWVRTEAMRRNPIRVARVAPDHPTRRLAARAIAQPTWENALWNDSPQMSGAPVQIVLPFMDPRIIAFAWSLPPVPWAQRKHLIRETLRARGAETLADRAKTPLNGYYDARAESWRRSETNGELHEAIGAWVDTDAWRREVTRGTSSDRLFECLRVRELSRWLSQPRGAATT
jgi:asparagine synthase (glutamine-hydrolysing)